MTQFTSRFSLPSVQVPVQVGLGGLLVGTVALFTWLPDSYYRMVAWPWIVLWQAGFVAAGLLLIGRLRQFNQPFYRLGQGFDWLLALTLVAVALSGLRSSFPAVALWNSVLMLGYGLLLYLGRQWLQPPAIESDDSDSIPGQLPWYHGVWSVLVVLSGVSAAISLGLWRPDPAMWQAGDFYASLRNPAPFGHHNFVGGYFALVLPLVGAWALVQKGWRYWIGLGLAVLVAAALYISGSRGAALGCLAWVLVTVLWATVTAQGRTRWQRLAIGGCLLLVLLAGLLTNPRVRTWFEGVRLGQSGTAGLTGGIAIADSPTLDRAFMLQLGTHILQERPLLGVGPGNMGRVSNLYRPIEAGEGLDHIQQLHNTPMQIAGELGLVGLSLYLSWWVLLGRLWWRLYRQLPTAARHDRALLYGSGGSLLAYGIASLTDYQLENIAISSTLCLTLLLLLALNQTLASPSASLPQRGRRVVSLGVLAALGLMIHTWLPFDLSLAFGQSGLQAEAQGQLTEAESRWFKASRLAPWDPTFSALAGEKLLEVDAVLGPSSLQQSVQESLFDYSLRALRAAPNDVWFNQNLAVLYYEAEEWPEAERFAQRAAQLLPRNQNFTYCLLGEIYAAQSKFDQAVAAFTLEALVHPSFLTYSLWSTPTLQPLYLAVVRSTLDEYAALLAQLPTQSPQYRSVYERWVGLRWWTNEPLNDVDQSLLRPLLRALIAAPAERGQALKEVTAAIAAGDPDPGLALLAAWLQPEQYLSLYQQQQGYDPAVTSLIAEKIEQEKDLRLWLTSLVEPEPPRYRGALAFAYRNNAANQLMQMLRPADLETYTFVEELGLFPTWPREFPALDHHIEQLRTERLQLPHPTHSGFRLANAL
ncbi:MAG TPA: O-antigen ligase family protein [Trichocoleus sp.]